MLDQKKIRQAKKLLENNESIPEGIVRPEILESWQRCHAKGIPMGNADKSLLPFSDILERIKKRSLMCNIAFPYLNALFTHIEGSHFLIMVTDEEGYILFAKGDKDIAAAGKKNGLTVGANRNENRLGTNGIGTVIVTKKPLLIFGAEHYYELHDSWACSGAPIFMPSGEVGGVVCLSGMAENVSPHTVGLVSAAADAISRQIKMQDMLNKESMMTEKLNLIIESFPDAIALLDHDLKISTFNHHLVELLRTKKEKLAGTSALDIIEKGSLTEEEIRNGVQERTVHLDSRFHDISVFFTIRKANQLEYVMRLVPTSIIHNRTNRIVGNKAWFSFDDIVGASVQIKDAVEIAMIAARNNSNVLLQGESGTGKELFAQSIHNASSRKNGPFIAVNCGAIPNSLIESELFGYETGSFTGARKEGAPGKFELADGGTIFLDEIDGMPLNMQVSLLRVLQNKEVLRIGARRPKSIDVRIIAASNQNLEKLVSDKLFRQDLYFRINVFNIKIPPLRDRTGDIPILAEFFLKKHTSDFPSGKIPALSESTLAYMTNYHWYGNIRELENVIERSVYMAKDSIITPECLPNEILNSAHSVIPSKNMQDEWQINEPLTSSNDPELPIDQSDTPVNWHHADSPHFTSSFSLKNSESIKIQEALAYTSGNVSEAALVLGISRRTLYRKLEQYNIDSKAFRKH